MTLTKTIIPTICKPKDDGTPALYSGHVTFKVPTYDQRQDFFLAGEGFDIIMDAAAKAKREGSNVNDAIEEVTTSMQNRSKMLAIYSNVKSQLGHWVTEVAITRLDDGFVFNNMTDVAYDSEVGAISQEIANEMLGKYRFGNPNVQQS